MERVKMIELDNCLAFITGKIEREDFEKLQPTIYKLTESDIKEMQNDSDRELFGSGCSY